MSLTATLNAIGGGALVERATDELAELVQAVDETGKPGTLTITIAIKKATKGGAMNVVGDTKLKKPGDSKIESILFGTPEGRLITEDPRQPKLDLRTVETDSRELRTA